MKILPTTSAMLYGKPAARQLTYLTIGIRLPDGHMPISHFRGHNVGVGGLSSRIATGEPVRRATLAELRQIDRANIARMLALYPNSEIEVRRSWAAYP